MVKIITFVLFVAVAVAVLGNPVEKSQSDYQVVEFEHQLRLPRATCDLLSGFGVADSACAAHCIAKKFKGGWCDKGVCHCRH